MSPIRILHVLLARWKLMAMVFTVAAAIGLGFAARVPRTYTAASTVLVDTRPDPVANLIPTSNPSFLATQIDIVQSSRVSKRVIRNLNLQANEPLRAQFSASKTESSFDEWLGRLIQSNLSVEPGRGSNVLRIGYTAPDPEFAKLIADAFVRAYLETVVEMRIEPARGYAEFFDERAKLMRDALEQAQTRLSAYQRSQGIVTTDERLDIETTRLNQLASQLVALQSQTTDTASRQTQATNAADRSQEVLSNGLIITLKSDLARQEIKMQELTSRLGSQHPQVVELRSSIAELRERIDDETRRILGALGVTDKINRQRESAAREALGAQRAKVLQLKAAHDELAVLQRDVENAQRAYDNVQQRLSQSSLESQNPQTAISVLNQAEVPLQSGVQRFAKLAAQAIVAAMALACAAAFGLELVDKRVRVREDVVDAVALPILGVLPAPRPPFAKLRRLLVEWLPERLLTQLPGAPT